MKRLPAPDPVLEGMLQACRELIAAGGVVLVARDGRPFAFYPTHASFVATGSRGAGAAAGGRGAAAGGGGGMSRKPEEPRLPAPRFLGPQGSNDDEIPEKPNIGANVLSPPLPRSLEAIKAWYRASQPQDPYRPEREPVDLPPRVIHQIKMSLLEGRPLTEAHLERLIEYANRLEPQDVRK